MTITKSGDSTVIVDENGQEQVYTHKFTDYENSTYEIVSKIAYLIGVPRSIFDNEHEPPRAEWYDALERNLHARIVRNLSILRTRIERNYKKTREEMRYGLHSIYTAAWTKEPMDALARDGITLTHTKTKKAVKYKLNQHIIDINHCLCDRINNCRELFPTWLNWDYVRSLFVMPDGFSEEGVKAGAKTYYENKGSYPYQMYIHFPCTRDWNLLLDDKRFVTALYEAHDDVFTDLSRVSDAGDLAKSSIREFLAASEKTVVVVDCENAAPYTLYAMLRSFDDEELTHRIAKIVLFDDVNAACAWDIFGKFTNIPVEHRDVVRVKEDKSVVDQVLTATTCRERYLRGTDSFIVVSSDSDYWGMIGEMKEDTRFYVMLEREKCSGAFTQKLLGGGVPYCFIDRFYTGDADEPMIAAVTAKFRELWAAEPTADPHELLHEARGLAYAEMSTVEEEQFYKRYIRPIISVA